MEIRFGTKEDLQILRDLLFEAFFWDPKNIRPNKDDFLNNPEISKLISDWGRIGDKMIIAEENEKIIGAGWYRLWTESNHSYGFVSSKIPELGIAFFPDSRSKGSGRIIMKELIECAKADEFTALSLSVDPNNYARNLYESEGFRKVGVSGTSWTYKLDL